MSIPWTKDRVISTIQMYHLKGAPLNYRFVNERNNVLRITAEKFFGSWGDAITAAGLDYEEIKKNKGSSEPYLAEDGVLYASNLEGLIADELYKLKSENKIIDYKSQKIVTHKIKCDFLVTLKNNSNLHIDVDKKEDLRDKIEYYEKANVFYYKLSSANNIQNIIERFTNWFTIPICNCVITCHIDPDGDAISSMVALYNYIIKNKKKAAIRIHGAIPKNLMWIIENINVVKKVPEWAEMVFVLDCAPHKERIGWEPNLPIYNIDHHISRMGDNDPDNNIHIIKSCSTASLLFSRFGIKDDILLIGVYTDTYFHKQIYEVFNFISQLNIKEDILESYIARVSVNPDKKIWDLLQEVKMHKCRNGFVIIESDTNYSPDIVESFMQILMKLNESICFIYGSNKSVKLRTSNPLVDVSKIAEEYGGGGHPYAAICSVEGKRSELRSKITSLSVPKGDDGYSV